MVPDGPRAIKDIEDGLHTAQDAPKRPQEASTMRPKRAPRRKHWPVPFVFSLFCCEFAFWAFRRSQTAQGAPKTAPKRPKKPPRGP
eukprot:6882529-Pyramimonas_sp.AAC.1